MRKFLVFLALQFAFPAAAQISQPGPNSAQRLGGVWAFSAVTLDGSSDTIPVNTGVCKSMIIVNTSGNAIIYVDPSGGTASSTRGIPVPPSTATLTSMLALTGAMAPCSKVTVIGTNTNIIQVWQSP